MALTAAKVNRTDPTTMNTSNAPQRLAMPSKPRSIGRNENAGCQITSRGRCSCFVEPDGLGTTTAVGHRTPEPVRFNSPPASSFDRRGIRPKLIRQLSSELRRVHPLACCLARRKELKSCPLTWGQISADADTSDSVAGNAVRYLPGGAPSHRTKVRLNAYSEVYPTSRAMCATGSAVSRSSFAANSVRHFVRYSAGGHPTSVLKRRPSVARETPALLAGVSSVHGCAGSRWIAVSAAPVTGSVSPRSQDGGCSAARLDSSQTRNS